MPNIIAALSGLFLSIALLTTPGFGNEAGNMEDLSAGLVSFNAKELNRKVVINWETSEEKERLRFEVQRRETNENKWEILGFVRGQNGAQAHSYEYVDAKAGVGSYQYRLKQTHKDGSSLYSPTLEIEIAPNSTSKLGPDTATEFNPGTFIRYQLSETSYVKLTIFNTDGEAVRALINGEKDAGNYAVRWDGKDDRGKELKTGSYFYTLKIYGDPIVSKQMLTIK